HPEPDSDDDDEEDEVEDRLPGEGWPVGLADDLATLVLPHRVDIGLVVAGEPLLGRLALHHGMRPDRRSRGVADVLRLAVVATGTRLVRLRRRGVVVARLAGPRAAALFLDHPARNLTPRQSPSPPPTFAVFGGPAR